ncbi:hypothetical protein C7H62_0490 [Mesoflavibacter sp. HG96]|uniref:hypothetical protein n=1 Tax=unclassified Mesoflavibacter TaxID=2630131 RepID=UPI000D0F3C82|nr:MULTISPECIES: hypothetical protein [unclassified Mesoflavibacter]QIJ88299.1 hypothetical protein C7H62_0490 [Mesoflavibacter sp. HG96]QIJ91027.1 hypothetical protein C7H56_0490 [Mesoflavibacter sp. HG37]
MQFDKTPIINQNRMFKQKVIVLILCLIGISCQKKNQTIEEFGKSVFQTYKTDLTKQNELYLNKSELKKVLRKYGQTDFNNDRIKEYIDFTIEKQKEHIDLAKYDMEIAFNEFNWNSSQIDSITYDIIFPKPGKDSIIFWPNSKTMELNDFKENFVTKIYVYGNDNDKKIRMELESVVYLNEKFKLHENRPKFEYINE